MTEVFSDEEQIVARKMFEQQSGDLSGADMPEQSYYHARELLQMVRDLDATQPLSQKKKTIDLSELPAEADFIVGSTNAGLTVHAQIGDVLEFGDTPQEALDNAISAFSKSEPKKSSEYDSSPAF